MRLGSITRVEAVASASPEEAAEGREHRADAIFALPELPEAVALYGSPPGWLTDLRERSIEVVPSPTNAGRPPDLAVATDEGVEEALASGARSLIVDGARDAHRLVRARGFDVTRLMPLPVSGSPVLFLDVGQRRAARYGIEHGIVHAERWRIVRNRVAALLVGAGVLLPVQRLLTLGTRAPGAPALVSAAEAIGAVRDAAWVMLVSSGSVVRRNAFLLFAPGAAAPSQVLKFARVPGMTLPFDRDERGARLVARAGGAVAARAPEYLGRFERDGYHAALEQAAVGTKLANLLRHPSSRRAKLDAVEPVARWLIDVARQTASSPARLAAERERLAEDVLPFWGQSAELANELAPVPSVFLHNDVAEENVVVSRADFTVLDWEWANPHGLPLSDLVYFGVHVLRIVDGALDEAARDRHFVDVLAGRAPSSPVLFGWIRELVEVLALPPESVGPLVTLSWLDRGKLSRQERHRAEKVGGVSLGKPFAERAANTWISHPELGSSWDAWRR
jgi:hypothetical protein